jgi:cell division protein FtsZ
LITIPNEKLLKVLGRGVTLLEAFASANDVLKNAVQGIAELITRPGMINVDFADVRTVMSELGHAMMGSGVAKGEDRAEEAAEMAISSPLLEDIDLAGARGVLVNITAGLDMRLDEFETVGNTVKAFASDNATVVIGTSLDPDMADEIRVTVVATGIGNEKKPDITLVAGGKAKVAPVAQPQTQPQAAPAPQASVNKVEEKPAPTLQEKPQTAAQPTTTPTSSGAGQSAVPKADKESGYLDIPAFLRRQAD